MTAGQWAEVERLLHEALQIPSAARQAFVDSIADAAVRAEVALLLATEAGRTVSGIGTVVAAAAQGLEQPSEGSVIGRFRVLCELGRGGMGVVYVAIDSKLQRQVALKLLPVGLHRDQDRLHRFEREARLAAALNHLNIVTVFEIGEWQSRPFIAAEFVPGETLAQLLTRGPLPMSDALKVSGQILAALGVAHQAGIVHRDLKPANVMMRPDGVVKVLDFGLARLMPAAQPVTPTDETRSMTHTVAGQILGTPAYMAPEQWEGKGVDARTDLYAFGCVLYEIVTGCRAGRERRPLSSPALEKIVKRCLEPEPERRWQSAAELELELARLARGGNRRKQIAIAAGVLLPVIGAVFFWLQRTPAAALTDKDVVVISEFSNGTTDPVFEGTLRQALTIQIEQSPFLKIMDDAQMRQDLRLMGRSPAEIITGPLAHDICVRNAAAATIEGSIVSLGKAYALTIQAVNCKNGSTLARAQSQAPDKEHVLEAVATAATVMRAKLGESLASIEKLNSPLDRYTTSSLEALQNYALGYVPQSQGQFLAARPFFERAVELDPNFAMAYMGLSFGYGNAGDIAKRNEYQRKAFALADRVSEFERLLISGRYHEQIAGELDKSIEFYQRLRRTYPRSWHGPGQLELIYNSTGEYEKAVEEGLTAIRNDPRVEPPYRNLATAYIGLNQLADAKAILAQARAQHLDGSRLHQRVLEIAYAEGDQVAAGREVQWYAGRPDEYIGLALEAANADATGRREEAGKLYRRAAAMALQRGLREGGLELEDLDARAEALYGDCQRVRRAGRPALALALCGETAAAERLVAETSKLVPNGTLWKAVHRPAILAASELRRGDSNGAIQRLASAAPYERAYPEISYLRGLAYLGLRKGPEAAAEFRKIVDHRGARWGILYALSQVGLGRAALLSGDTALARRTYQDFFALWKNADGGARILREARKEFASIPKEK